MTKAAVIKDHGIGDLPKDIQTANCVGWIIVSVEIALLW